MSQSIPGRPIAPSPLAVYLLDTFNISTAPILVLLEWLFTLFYHFIRCMWVRHDNHQRVGAYVKFQRVASFIRLTYYECSECFYE